MADNKRDIELRIAATTSGADAIRKLGDELQTLGKEGGESADKFKELGNELDRLGSQGDALQALNAVQTTVNETSGKFAEATARAKELSDALAQQRSTTDTFKASQKQAGDAVRETEAQLRQQVQALRTLRAESDGAERSTVGYKDKVQSLRGEIAKLQGTLAEQKAAFKDARQATGEQNAALAEVEQQYNKADKAVGRLQRALDTQNGALDKAKTGLNDLGVEASSVDAALVNIEAALDGVTRAASEQVAAYRQLSAIERAVAEANERNVALARKAATDRVAAGKAAAQAANEQAAAEAKIGYAAEEAAAKLQALIDRSRASGQAINEAFGVLGVRSATAIRDEINAVGAAMIKLTNNANVTGEDFDRAFAQAQTRVRQLNDELEKSPGQVEKTTRGVGFLTSGLKQLAAAYIGIDLANKFVDANIQIETLRRSLTLVTGSTEAAARQIQLLRDTANTAGISIGEISGSFVKFQAALNGANIPLETTESLFRAVVNASGQLGLSSSKTSLILDALAQTASKSVVSMEELRQQLGDSLPGALDLSAKGLGLTTAELVKLVESGQLLAVDFLPALKNALIDTFGTGAKEVEGLGQSINRFKNTLTTISQAIGDSGVSRALSFLFDTAGTGAKLLTFQVERLALGFEFFGKRVGVVFDGIKNRDFAGILSGIEQLEVEREAKLTKFVGTLEGVGTAAGAASAGVAKTAEAATAAGAAAAASAANVTTAANAHAQGATAAQANAGAQNAAAGAAGANAAAQGASAQATNAAAAAANGAGNSWVKLTAAFAANQEAMTNDIAIAEKLADAKKIEGDARVSVAKIAGDGIAVLTESAAAGEAEALSLANVAEKRVALVTAMEKQRAALVEEIARLGDVGGARKKVVDGLQQQIDLQIAAAEKSLQAANAARVEADSRELAVRATRDNSSALVNLRDAYNTAQATLTRYIQLERDGLATATQVQGARVQLARAEFLYNDALSDTTRALELRVSRVQADFNATKASLSVKLETARADEASARAIGNETGALEANIQQKRVQIDITRAAKDEKIAEANATIQKLEADRAEIRGMDDLSVAKRAEIDLRIQNERAKVKEAGASDAIVRGLEAEIDALRRRGAAGGAGGGRQISGIDPQQADKSQQGPISGTYDIGALAALQQKKSNGTLSANDLQLAESAYNAALFNNQSIGGAARQGLASLDGQRDAGGKVLAAKRLLEEVRALQQGGGSSLGGGAAQTGNTSGQSGLFSTVKIELNGRSTNINTASQADAAALTNLMREIGVAKGTAGPGG